MAESNYDILGVAEGSTPKQVQEAFRRLALLHHEDRGGDTEQFKKIRQAYEDIREGKKYPQTPDEARRSSRVYSGDDEEEARRRNRILAKEITEQMRLAQDWAASMGRTKSTGRRLFGSKALGEVELEIKANGALSIKGNIMAGSLSYDGPITMQGNITSPTFSGQDATRIALERGDFAFVNPLENKYRIENGARIEALQGNITIGNVFGRRFKTQDPGGRIGIYTEHEQRSVISCPAGRLMAENAVNAVDLIGSTVIVLNMEDGVRAYGKEILVYGNKITYDVELHLRRGGQIRFFEANSILSLSDDAAIVLEDQSRISLHELKTRKIRDIPGGLAPSGSGQNDTMVGRGFAITYEMLEALKPSGQAWSLGSLLRRK